MLVLWAQLVSMSESRRVGLWRGVYLHPPPVQSAERSPALTWVRVAQFALASGLVPSCRTVTPGEGRMIYCMQAHENKISTKCAFELGEAATSVQSAADALKDAVIACKAEISGVCGKVVPGQGRIAACLLSNKSTASAGCTEAIQKIESIAAQ